MGISGLHGSRILGNLKFVLNRRTQNASESRSQIIPMSFSKPVRDCVEAFIQNARDYAAISVTELKHLVNLCLRLSEIVGNVYPLGVPMEALPSKGDGGGRMAALVAYINAVVPDAWDAYVAASLRTMRGVKAAVQIAAAIHHHFVSAAEFRHATGVFSSAEALLCCCFASHSAQDAAKVLHAAIALRDANPDARLIGRQTSGFAHEVRGTLKRRRLAVMVDDDNDEPEEPDTVDDVMDRVFGTARGIVHVSRDDALLRDMATKSWILVQSSLTKNRPVELARFAERIQLMKALYLHMSEEA